MHLGGLVTSIFIMISRHMYNMYMKFSETDSISVCYDIPGFFLFKCCLPSARYMNTCYCYFRFSAKKNTQNKIIWQYLWGSFSGNEQFLSPKLCRKEICFIMFQQFWSSCISCCHDKFVIYFLINYSSIPYHQMYVIIII